MQRSHETVTHSPTVQPETQDTASSSSLVKRRKIDTENDDKLYNRDDLFSRFPEEMIMAIFFYLSWLDLKEIQNVSQLFRRLGKDQIRSLVKHRLLSSQNLEPISLKDDVEVLGPPLNYATVRRIVLDTIRRKYGIAIINPSQEKRYFTPYKSLWFYAIRTRDLAVISRILNVMSAFLKIKGTLSEKADDASRTTLKEINEHLTHINDAFFVQITHHSDVVNVRDALGRTGLMYAAAAGDVMLVHTLLRNGADFLIVNNSHQSAFCYAVTHSQSEVIKYLVKFYRPHINCTNINIVINEAIVCIRIAMQQNDSTNIHLLLIHLKALIAHSSSIMDALQQAEIFQSVFNFAASNGEVLIIGLLMNHYEIFASLDLSEIILTALLAGKLHFAFNFSHELKNLKIDLDNYILSQLENAANAFLLKVYYSGDIEQIKISLEFGADCNMLTHQSIDLPFLTAVQSDDLDVTSLFLKHGAYINCIHQGGKTPLMYAAKTGSLKMINLLLEHGADASQRDKYQFSAGDYARNAGHPNIANKLYNAERAQRALKIKSRPQRPLAPHPAPSVAFFNLFTPQQTQLASQSHLSLTKKLG